MRRGTLQLLVREVLETLQFQALLASEESETNDSWSKEPRLTLEEGAYGSPLLLPENKMNCLGKDIPPTVPVNHSRQRKMVKQRFYFFFLLMHSLLLL